MGSVIKLMNVVNNKNNYDWIDKQKRKKHTTCFTISFGTRTAPSLGSVIKLMNVVNNKNNYDWIDKTINPIKIVSLV